MLGKINFTEFEPIGDAPQEIASACSAIETSGLCGASFKPLLYIGTQMARGINYWFIAEEIRQTNPIERHIVTIAVNSFNGVYAIVPGSIEVIIA